MLPKPFLFHKPKTPKPNVRPILIPRTIEPELLDRLPADDPDAIRSRGDLRMINALMGNQRWILRQLKRLARGETTNSGWELGAGDGVLGAQIARRLGTGNLASFNGLDIAPRSPLWPEKWDWHQRDILEVAAESPATDVVIANLILHHFENDELGLIGKWISQANTVIAVEPLRARFPHALAYAVRLLGINHVTREDIHTSIHAGFCGNELPQVLGLENSQWDIRVSATPLGAYRLLAQRRMGK